MERLYRNTSGKSAWTKRVQITPHPEKVQFGYIATRLMHGDLSLNELLDTIEIIGNRGSRQNLERIGLYYNFKKNSFSLSLYRKRSSGKQKVAPCSEKD